MMSGGQNSSASDFLGSLIKTSHDPDAKKRVSQQEIIDECKTFYNSEQDKTTSLLSWAALLLAIHTDWQDKVRTEVVEVFGRENPSPEGISKLKTMSMIINETLRLYTPVLNVVRTITSEIRLEKFVFPDNMELFILLCTMTLTYGDEMCTYLSWRDLKTVWLRPRMETLWPFYRLGWATFFGGMNFASAEVKIALAMVLQHYKFTLSVLCTCTAEGHMARPQHRVIIILQTL